MSNLFEAGDRVLLVDRKDRRYLVTLEAGGEFHSHTGVVDHDDLIGSPDGGRLRSSRGAPSWRSGPPSATSYSRCPGAPR